MILGGGVTPKVSNSFDNYVAIIAAHEPSSRL